MEDIQQIRNKVEKMVMDDINQFYNTGNIEGMVKLYEEAWNLLPNDKFQEDMSYLICQGMINCFTKLEDYDNSKKWEERLFKSDLSRMDDGDREYISAVMHFEFEQWDKSIEMFIMANEKSEGYCFDGESKKYYKFFKKNRPK